jgi:hypothetical protein
LIDHGDELPVAADAAFVLEPAVPYPRRWAEANEAGVRLRGQLHRLGLVEAADQVRAQVNAAGVGVVELGSVSPQTARALAELLAGAGPPRPRSPAA